MTSDIFGALERASTSDPTDYNPRHIIDAVNALIPLGKEEALATVANYYHQANLNEDLCRGLFWVLRVLFEVPEDPGYHPPVHLGASRPAAPANKKDIPRFPIILLEDVPILMVMSYVLGGLPESVEDHLNHFKMAGVIRTAPMHTTINGLTQEDIGRILATFKNRYQHAYGAKPSSSEMESVRMQLERMAHGGDQKDDPDHTVG